MSAARIKEKGCECLADVRWTIHRRKAQALGWYAAFNLYEVRVLELLKAGPLPVPEIAKALGLKYDPESCRTQTLCRELALRGLIKGKRGFGTPLVYELA